MACASPTHASSRDAQPAFAPAARAVGNLTVVPGDRSTQLLWQPVAGATKYRVRWRQHTVKNGKTLSGWTRKWLGKVTLPSRIHSFTITGLTNGNAYQLRLETRSRSKRGWRVRGTTTTTPTPAKIPEAAITEPILAPSAPATPTAVAGNTQATITVTNGTGNGGPPTSYTATTVGDATKNCTITVPDTSCDITGLTNGTGYTFTATATNSAGTSAPSSASSSVTPATVPSPPTLQTCNGPQLISGRDVGYLCPWAIPTDDGGSPIIRYAFTAIASRDGVNFSRDIATPETCTVTTFTQCYLLLDHNYFWQVTVTATNAVGTSTASNVFIVDELA